MKEHTVKLLEEINKGCLMAGNSFHQLERYEMRDELAQILDKYRDEHEKIQTEAEHLLEKLGEEKKKPHPLTEAMSWISTEMKMMMKDCDTQIAKLMMDGCNMGIQTIGQKINEFSDADQEAERLGKELIKLEQKFMDELKAFL